MLPGLLYPLFLAAFPAQASTPLMRLNPRIAFCASLLSQEGSAEEIDAIASVYAELLSKLKISESQLTEFNLALETRSYFTLPESGMSSDSYVQEGLSHLQALLESRYPAGSGDRSNIEAKLHQTLSVLIKSNTTQQANREDRAETEDIFYTPPSHPSDPSGKTMSVSKDGTVGVVAFNRTYLNRIWRRTKKTIQWIDLETPKVKHTPNTFYETHITSDKALIFGFYDDSMKIWDANSGKILAEKRTPPGTSLSFGRVFSQDESFFALDNERIYSVRQILASNSPELTPFASFDADAGKTIGILTKPILAAVKSRATYTLSAITQNKVRAIPFPVDTRNSSAGALSPDSRTAAYLIEKKIHVFETRTGKPIDSISVENASSVQSRLTFSPDGQSILFADRDFGFKIIDLKTNQIMFIAESQVKDSISGYVKGEFLLNGRIALLTSFGAGSIPRRGSLLADSATGRILFELPTGYLVVRDDSIAIKRDNNQYLLLRLEQLLDEDL